MPRIPSKAASKRSAPATSAERQDGQEIDRVGLLFQALMEEPGGRVSASALLKSLEALGLRADDVRLQKVRDALRALRARQGDEDVMLDLPTFDRVVQSSLTLIDRAHRGELVIPEFAPFAARVTALFEQTRRVSDGVVATYIPQLARVDPDKWGLGLCTVDGQRLALGDSQDPFCVQSTCKPVNYCLALEDSGAEVVHSHVGFEPSGGSFNQLSLNAAGRPHNPMINAGAIMACSLIGRGMESADRFDHVTSMWRRLCGGTRPGFANAVYLSERRTADRNFALGYFMREHGAFPESTSLHETLEFYFQCCSLEVTADAFALAAATLANGGVCPLTEERVLQPDTVRKCLSLMESCGMYDFSGEWAFTVGLPAKSGVSGAIMVVVPDTLGLCVWSPRLDRIGNSVRGIRFCQSLVAEFNFHHYDNLIGGLHGKSDPRGTRMQAEVTLLSELLWASSKDDVTGMRRAAVRGQSLAAADYDGRTALHVAASEGRLASIRYLLAQGVPLDPRDRWGGCPLDDARREGHAAAEALIAGAMGSSNGS